MSITYINTRYEPDGRLCHAMEPQHISAGHAVIRLVRYELGYGGRIEELTPTLIKVYTSMMGRYDIVEFKGSEQEMMPLMLAISAWAYGKQMKGKEHIKQTVDQMVSNGINRPFHVTMMASLMFSGWVDPILCATAGLNEAQAKTLMDRVNAEADRLVQAEKAKPWGYQKSRNSIRSDIIDPVIELIIDGGNLDEALELIAT